MCRNEIIIMMERERVLSWPELNLTGSWPALDPSTLVKMCLIRKPCKSCGCRLKGTRGRVSNLMIFIELTLYFIILS